MMCHMRIGLVCIFTLSVVLPDVDGGDADEALENRSSPQLVLEVPSESGSDSSASPSPPPAPVAGPEVLLLPPGHARFCQVSPPDPDSIQEILTVKPLPTHDPGASILPDFATTKGRRLGIPDTTNPTDKPSSNELIVNSATFENAAHFAFGADCAGQSPGNDRPVVIYEGMTVTAADDGRYEVRFVVEAPDSNVILKLQLRLCDWGCQQEIGTITLPPVILSSSTTDDSFEDTSVMSGATRTWVVRRTGYSRLLTSAKCQNCQQLTVTRSGTIRIGQSPDSYTSY